MIKINQLTKSFKRTKAVDHVTLDIAQSNCTALIGVNGAGKSTLIDLILGNLHPDSGTIDMDGFKSSQIGVLFQKTVFNDFVKVKELYRLYASFYKDPLTFDAFQKMTQFSKQQMNQYANKLSGGQQRLLDFALVMVGKPQLIILDEPTSAMDAKTRRYFWSLIETLKTEGKTILYTTHYLEEVERVADRVVVLRKGQVINDTTPSKLRHENRASTICIPEIYEPQIKQHITLAYQKHQGELRIVADNVQAVLVILMGLKLDLNEIEIKKGSIEDYVFEGEGEVSA